MKFEYHKLGDYIHIKHGYAFKSKYFSFEKGNKIVLTPGNFIEVGGFKRRPDKDRFYTGDFPNEFLLGRNDVIIAMTEQTYGLLGSPAIIPESGKYLHNQRLGKLVVKNKKLVSLKYFYYLFFLRGLRDEISNSASGTKIRHTAPERIYKLSIPTPSKAIQRKIAAILSAYDDLIENNNRRIAILEKMAEEFYREWFVRLRFPGHEHVKILKGVPDGWAAMKSSEVLDILGGGTPKTDIPSNWDGNIPFFTPKDSHDGYFAYATEKNITELGLQSCNSQYFPKNTIFITARGTVGNVVLALRPMAMNQSCYALIPKSNNFRLFHFLALRDSVAVIKGTSNSGVFDNIITDSFKQFGYLIPNDDLLMQFERIAQTIFCEMEILFLKNRLASSSRDRLLSRLMSGAIDVENLDIEFPKSMQEEAIDA